MIHATAGGSYAKQPGDKGVLVGIIDTGIDGTHPDIAPNFDAALSRNFVTDIPSIDGPCEHPSCVDPANEDDDGHGTHVAGTIGAALNGLGIAGVAPNVTLVNIRAGQDSGFFFLQPTVDALTYAADNGIDVVNMSFFTDPWLYNCASNPADTPEQQLEQRTIIQATNRALDYADSHGVTLVAAEGNEHTDLGNPTSDDTSPDYPLGTAYHRDRRQLVPGHADGGQPRDRRRRGRAEHDEGRLLELGHRADRRHRAGRLLPRLLRDAAVPDRRERDPLDVPAVARGRERRAQPGRLAEHAVRRPRLPERRPARTTSTCRARRWPRRTRSAWPR